MTATIALDLGLEKAARHLARGDGRLALVELDALARADGQAAARPDWWHARIRAVWSCGRPEEAIEGTARALSIWPHAPALLQLRAEILAECGWLAEAEDIIRFVLGDHPDHPFALATYAMILSRGGEHETARKLSERALRHAPEEPALLGLRLAVADAAGAADAELDEHLDTLLAADPESPDALHLYSMRAVSRGRLDEARSTAAAAARGMPGDAEITDHARSLQCLDHRSMWLIRQMRRRGWRGSWPWVAAFLVGSAATINLLGGFAVVALLWAYARFWPAIHARRQDP